MPHGYEITFAVKDTNTFAFLQLAISMMDGTRENPGMEAFQTLVFSFLEI